jgi:hypothetical protein
MMLGNPLIDIFGIHFNIEGISLPEIYILRPTNDDITLIKELLRALVLTY